MNRYVLWDPRRRWRDLRRTNDKGESTHPAQVAEVGFYTAAGIRSHNLATKSLASWVQRLYSPHLELCPAPGHPRACWGLRSCRSHHLLANVCVQSHKERPGLQELGFSGLSANQSTLNFIGETTVNQAPQRNPLTGGWFSSAADWWSWVVPLTHRLL